MSTKSLVLCFLTITCVNSKSFQPNPVPDEIGNNATHAIASRLLIIGQALRVIEKEVNRMSFPSLVASPLTAGESEPIHRERESRSRKTLKKAKTGRETTSSPESGQTASDIANDHQIKEKEGQDLNLLDQRCRHREAEREQNEMDMRRTMDRLSNAFTQFSRAFVTTLPPPRGVQGASAERGVGPASVSSIQPMNILAKAISGASNQLGQVIQNVFQQKTG